MPKLDLNASLSEWWELNAEIESKLIFREGFYNGPSKQQYRHHRTNISVAGKRKIGNNTSVTGGYLLKIQENNLLHRLLQEYSLKSTSANFTLGHRFAADQTFNTGSATEYRLRYRISATYPLSETSRNVKNSYLKFENEYLGSLENKSTALEIRVLAAIGFIPIHHSTLETGISYRACEATQPITNNEFWLYVGLSLNLN